MRTYLTLQTELALAMYRGEMLINAKQHSDKKTLKGYGKDSESVHRWLMIEFINEK